MADVWIGQTKLLVDRGQEALPSPLIEAKEPHWGSMLQGWVGKRLEMARVTEDVAKIFWS